LKGRGLQDNALIETTHDLLNQKYTDKKDDHFRQDLLKVRRLHIIDLLYKKFLHTQQGDDLLFVLILKHKTRNEKGFAQILWIISIKIVQRLIIY
jgi:hypothetical protein